jgi:hypothetical protein
MSLKKNLKTKIGHKHDKKKYIPRKPRTANSVSKGTRRAPSRIKKFAKRAAAAGAAAAAYYYLTRQTPTSTAVPVVQPQAPVVTEMSPLGDPTEAKFRDDKNQLDDETADNDNNDIKTLNNNNNSVW